jgi:carotenoid cleavage dioxygenase-like enzyme
LCVQRYTTAFKQLQDEVVALPTVTGHTSGNVLLKHDVQTGAVQEHRFEHGAAGEAVFAPTSFSAGEDEGYVMAFAHDLDGGGTDLVILAAQDFGGERLRAFTCRSAFHWDFMAVGSPTVRHCRAGSE